MAPPPWRQRLDALNFSPQDKGTLIRLILAMQPDERELIVDDDPQVAMAALNGLMSTSGERLWPELSA